MLGFIQDPHDYPPFVAENIYINSKIIGPREPLTDQIKRRTGFSEDQIDTVIPRYAQGCRTMSSVFRIALTTPVTHILIIAGQ